MGNRRDFGYRQLVTQSDLDAAFAYAESDRTNFIIDNGWYGIVTGMTPTLGSAPNVNITKGVAYSKLGKRIPAYSDGASTKGHSYANDTAGVSTAVTSGQERWISIFANFGRQALDGRTDGNSQPYYFDQPENLHDGTNGPTGVAGLGGAGVDKFLIVAGTSAPTGTATRPALQSDAVLVCDIKRTPSDASNVLDTTRTESGLLQALSAWLGGRTNPATGIGTAIGRIITDLAATTSSDDGCERIGAQAGINMPSGSARSQLDWLEQNAAILSVASSFTAKQTFSAGTASAAAIGFGSVTDGQMQLLSQQGNSLNAKKWRIYAVMSTSTVLGITFVKGDLVFCWNVDFNAGACDVASSPHYALILRETQLVFAVSRTGSDTFRQFVLDMSDTANDTLDRTLTAGGKRYEVGVGGNAAGSGACNGFQTFVCHYSGSSPSVGTITQDSLVASTNIGSLSVNSVNNYGFRYSASIAGPGQYIKSAQVIY